MELKEGQTFLNPNTGDKMYIESFLKDGKVELMFEKFDKQENYYHSLTVPQNYIFEYGLLMIVFYKNKKVAVPMEMENVVTV